MHKVFLADDEQYILDGLAAGIPWEAQGFTVCGTAGDGKSALEEIGRLRPDVVFTDIRMPCLSGLDLIARVKPRLSGTFFVVISGHAEFEYAKTAIEHGVDGYVLKPIETDEVVAHLVKFRRILDLRLSEARSSSLMASIEDDDGDAFRACLHGGVVQSIVANGARMEALEGRGSTAACRLAGNRWLYVSSQEYMPRKLHAMAAAEVSGVGVVTAGEDGTGAPSAWVGEAIVRSYGFFMDPGSRIRTVGYGSDARQRYLHLLGLLSHQTLRKDGPGVEATLAGLRDLLPEVSITELSRSWSLLDSLYPPDGGDERVEPGFHSLVERWPDARACFADFARAVHDAVLPPFEGEPEATDNRLVTDVITYLRGNLEGSPALPDLAERFHVGHVYLSRLFKKETGMGLSKYLMRLKMERSRTLLAKTGLSVNEVAQESGFGDYLYFRKVFKRNHGVTPTEYRRRESL